MSSDLNTTKEKIISRLPNHEVSVQYINPINMNLGFNPADSNPLGANFEIEKALTDTNDTLKILDTTSEYFKPIQSPLEKAKFFQESANILKTAHKTTQASKVGEGVSIATQELSQLAISKSTELLVSAGVRGTALVIGMSDFLSPAADIALQTAATHVISNKLAGKMNDYLFDLKNPDTFGDLTRQKDHTWTREYTTWETQSGMETTIGPVTRHYRIKPGTDQHEWLEQQRHVKKDLKSITKDSNGNPTFKFNDALVTISPLGITQFEQNGNVFRQEKEQTFYLSQYNGEIYETPIKANSLDWANGRIISKEALLNEPNEQQYNAYQSIKAQLNTDKSNYQTFIQEYGDNNYSARKKLSQLSEHNQALSKYENLFPRLKYQQESYQNNKIPAEQLNSAEAYLQRLGNSPEELALAKQNLEVRMSVNYLDEFRASTAHKYQLPVKEAEPNTTYTGTIVGHDGYDTTTLSPEHDDKQFFTLMKTKENIILLPKNDALLKHQHQSLTIQTDDNNNPAANLSNQNANTPSLSR